MRSSVASAPSRPVEKQGHRPGFGTALAVLVIAVGAGYGAAVLTTPVVHSRYFPWIVGRALGLSAYCCLCVLVALGIWLRHPWRLRWTLFRHESVLRYHAVLAGATVLLVVGHLASLASDSYAGVGWIGALLPGRSVYRPVPVGLGVAAWWGLLLIAGTAGIGGRLVGRRWLPIHRLAMPVFATVFAHGVLAGTDGGRLRLIYAASGGLILVLRLSRHLASHAWTAGSGEVSDRPQSLYRTQSG